GRGVPRLGQHVRQPDPHEDEVHDVPRRPVRPHHGPDDRRGSDVRLRPTKEGVSASRNTIPSTLNVALVVAACSTALALLWTASHTTSYVAIAACALAFSYVNNTVFSLTHEAVHGKLLRNRAANDWLGRVTAAFFPTSLTFHRTCHLGH